MHSGNPDLPLSAFPQFDLILQRAISEDPIAPRVAEHQVFKRPGTVPGRRNEMFDAPRIRRIRFGIEVEVFAAQPAEVTVAGTQTIDLAQIHRARHAIGLATYDCGIVYSLDLGAMNQLTVINLPMI